MASGEIHGRVVSVSVEVAGDENIVHTLSGSQTVYLTDASDFDEDGGQCLIDGTVYTYDSVDMDGNSIHLTSGLTADIYDGDRVDLYDPDTSNAVAVSSALVVIDGQDDGDPVDAEVDHALVPLLEREVRTEGLSVTLVPDGGGFRLTQINGKENPGKLTSTASEYHAGLDMGDGTTTGLRVVRPIPDVADYAIVELVTSDVASPYGRVNVVGTDGVFMPIYASAFNVTSDSIAKTDISDPPDATAIIADAPAKAWRYTTDPDDVQRIGPLADDLPDWMTSAADPHGDEPTKTVDLARMVGVLWEANAQLTARVAALEAQTNQTAKGSR